MTSDDRWTPDVCEAWLDALLDKPSQEVATDQLRSLLLTARDGLQAMEEVERLRGLVERQLRDHGGFCLRCCGCGDDDGHHATPEQCAPCWEREARAALRGELQVVRLCSEIDALEVEIERLGLAGRHSALQVTRLCDELNRLRETQPRWVAVEERLPEEEDGESVMFTDGDQRLVGEFVAPNIWLAEDGGMYCTKIEGVTHWMPLPPLPEEDA